MREIKFRAWDEQNHDMHYNFQWIDSGREGNDWIIFRSDKQRLSSKPHPFEDPYFRQQYHIMECTALKDKKGKEIYEGDIIKADLMFQKEPLGTMGQIVYDDEHGSFANLNEAGKTLLHNMYMSSIEVIGNIHQNPEIIERAK